MSLNDILSSNSGRRPANRVGRGAGSGNGKTCGRGSKGEGSRSGGPNRSPLFEGGQNPLWMRIPRRGFSNHRHRVAYQVLPLARVLARVEGDVISIESLKKAGLVSANERIKLVSGSDVGGRKLTVEIHRVTSSVRKAIEDAGGSIREYDAPAAAESGAE
ncbi:MAG: 50S ribosomal protein L15 [Planctomycetota bacterium]|nr:MAG: 50S ribosomal protein L15 [Planctomycetota bacterium]